MIIIKTDNEIDENIKMSKCDLKNLNVNRLSTRNGLNRYVSCHTEIKNDGVGLKGTGQT